MKGSLLLLKGIMASRHKLLNLQAPKHMRDKGSDHSFMLSTKLESIEAFLKLN